uniref:Uncharacterized protein n=1 Tax=Rhizophora mucronata TaxID=61149 RepID=A0A2P2NVN7_RHIMU
MMQGRQRQRRAIIFQKNYALSCSFQGEVLVSLSAHMLYA